MACSNKNGLNGVDRISNLPDSVLCFILSFLKTRESVKTCILSKRWNFLWTNVPSLDFRFRRPYSCIREAKRSFERFVTMAMLLHRSQSLNKFHVEWEDADPFNLTACLSTAIARDVQVLDISVFYRVGNRHFTALPVSLFTCKSLEFLRLRGNFLVRVPSLVSLPRLETLELEFVHYEYDESVGKLILGCTVLKSLVIYSSRRIHHIRDNVVVFSISSPTLRHLTIKDFDLHVESFPTDVDVTLEINAPLLEYLDLSGIRSKDFRFQSLMSLVELHFNSSLHNLSSCNWVVKLVEALHCLKILALANSKTLLDFSEATACAGKKLQNLTKLTLNESWWQWKYLLRLLESSVHLQVLELKDYLYFSALDETCENDVPRCLSSSLERISILGFTGTENLVEMMKYFLKHGGSLKRVELYLKSYHSDVAEMYNMVKKISEFSRKSTECEILVLG